MWSVVWAPPLVVSVSEKHPKKSFGGVLLTISPGKGVGSLGSGIWNGVTGGGGKKEDAAQGEAEAEAEQKSSGGFFG
jgi:hypothetical protein